MTINLNDKLHGFKVTRVRKVEELAGTLYEMEHEKSGAKLAWLSNNQENKCFSITFKTTPQDDTGVFHILEHSVLNGSKLYTAKEPFVELLKSSLQTFLNAMTFPDKTMYPVSSRNATDFQNLMKVYLDAVFAPAIYHNPNIFYQEGWHYELRNKEDNPEYKGVVFNEMKGAFSSVDTLIQSNLNAMLFPDNNYKYESGGNPEHIPDLTYEKFIETHQHYYSPTNARIYLDGDLDIESTLEIIDSQYLTNYSKDKINHDIPLQELKMIQPVTTYYEIPQQEEEKGKTQLAIGQIIGTWKDRKKILAAQILGEYLTGSNDSPLKKTLLVNNLVQDINVQIYDGIQQPFIIIQASNFKQEDSELIKSTIFSTMEKLASGGLDVEELEAIMNQTEFQTRESSEPKGLIRNINAMNSWLFDGDPLLYLTCDTVFKQLREGLHNGYFLEVFKEVFLNQTKMAFLTLLPSKTLGQENRDKEAAKLLEQKRKWSNEQIEQIIELNKQLDQWQKRADTPEDLATLPKLDLKEVTRSPQERTTTITTQNGVTILAHPTADSGIIYLNTYFEVGDINKELLPQLGLLPNLLGNLPTKNYSVSQLQRAIKKDIGSLSFDLISFGKPSQVDECSIKLVARCSVLSTNFKKATSLITEILLNTKWNEPIKIKELFIQYDQTFQRAIVTSGSAFAAKRVASHFSADGYVRELTDGYSCYKWLHEATHDLDKQLKVFINNMESICPEVFSVNRLTLSVTAGSTIPDLTAFIASLPLGSKTSQFKLNRSDLPSELSEGIQIPSGVSYAVLGSHLNDLGKEYSGSLKVLSKILTLNYLWNEVRVKGGAYGCGFTIGESGNVFYSSYRDPNADKSLDTYRNAVKYLKEFCDSSEEIDKFIIGTIADLEPLLSVNVWSEFSDLDYFRGISKEDRQKEKAAILDLTKPQLLDYCDLLEKVAQQGAICVVGHEDALKKCSKENLVIHLL